MRLGVSLPFGDLEGGGLRRDSVIRAAKTIEELGFDSVWTFDTVGRGYMLPDSLMALAVVGAVTTRVELGTGIMQLPIRNVAEVAHRLFTLEQLAPGRVLFGVGPGSTADDFVTFDADFDTRFHRFDAQWDELRSWVGEGSFAERHLHPWPSVLGGPSLMLAGWRGGWVERAAAESDGWIASGTHADDTQLADGIGRFRDAGGSRAVVTNVQVGDDLGPVIDRVHHLAELGFDDIVIGDLRATPDRLAQLRAAIA